MLAKKSFLLSLIIAIFIASPVEAKSVYAGRGPSGHDDNPIAVNNQFIPDQRLAGIPGTAQSNSSSEPYAVHLTFQPGDLFVGVGNSQVYWYLPDGTLNKILTTGVSSSDTTGMVFDLNGNLYVTLFQAGTVCKFDNTGKYLGTFGSGYNGCPESIVHDAQGNFYVGTVDGDCDIKKFNAAGNLLAQYDVPIEDRGSDWIDLAADQCTMYYTSEGENILRYDVCADVALSNFNNSPLPGPYAFALRLIPTGGILVANWTQITRLDASGNVIKSYDASGENEWFALNLDPDGRSFWSAGYSSNNVYKFDIESGEILLSFNTGTTGAVGGLIVFDTPIRLTKVDNINDGDCVGPGDDIVYKISYGNAVTDPCDPMYVGTVNDVNIIDYLPAEVNYIPSDPCGVYDSNSHTVTWIIGTVEPGDANCITLIVKVNEKAEPGDVIKNECKITSGEQTLNWAYEDTRVCWPPGCIIYVDVNAPGNNNGTSWQDAYINLQDALEKAQLLLSPPSPCPSVEVRVADGTYRPDEGIAVEPNDREATFGLINNVAIYGGYAGYGEPDPNARDPNLYETILSGDLNGDDEPNFVNNDENSYHVVTGSGTDETAILDGFTITAGNAEDDGGGMYNEYSSPTITNCKFSGNSAEDGDGGGMCNYDDSSPTITNCTFSGNSASGGGGMYNSWYSSPTITDCNFSGNSADWDGGGMCNYDDSSPTITNCTFSGNSAEDGGGMYNEYSSPTITNCTFSGNTAEDEWGGGGGMYNSYSSDPNLTNCTFSRNSAGYSGGGVCNEHSSCAVVTNCTFSGNTATATWGCGGGMYNSSYSPTLTNCTFSGNSAGDSGGGMYNDSGSPTLINCTFSGNSAGDSGGGMYNEYSGPTLTNCIFWDDWAGNDGNEIALTDYSTVDVNYSDVEGGQAAVYDPCDRLVWGQWQH